MSDSLGTRKLARAAAHLALRSRAALPPLALFTDDDRLPDPLGAARVLPRGSMVVARSRDDARRAALAAAMIALARKRDLIVLVAGDPDGADGVHLPEARLRCAVDWRARRPSLLITASVHSFSALSKAMHLPLDAVFLSPVFRTASHPGRATLSPIRANLIARASSLPVYALGGIDAHNALLLSGFAGIAAIGALAV
ncbi:MAG: thiamine phosphate synthase [Alphaproteobacteria bacterium]|nr:thiamine phosphate synthase [Alphaproteobacteria bacterium]MDE2109561.1 thiamine phosphate synthase [Alphaproteobacteria bacterium]MDE2493346.1 thiamine phosphate synthase [Alphaproteobacteria bacterium]